MYTQFTFQDWEKTPDQERTELLLKIIDGYKASGEFSHALDAMAYFTGENTAVMQKVILQKNAYDMGDKDGSSKRFVLDKPIIGARIPSNFFFRFVTQQNQFLLSNGVTLEDDKVKKQLGAGFDKALESMGEKALIQGVCWAFWNVDHVEIIPAVRDALSGFVALLDEETSAPRLGVQFWQIDAERPLYVRLFEVDGVTVYRREKEELVTYREKQAYRLRVARDAAGEMITGAENYSYLPVIPLYANEEHRSELTESIKAKIDAYDRIASDFSDNFDKANDVYWVLNNFGGTTRQMLEMVNAIRNYSIVANIADPMGGNATATPHTFEVPYEARQTALKLLEKSLYADYMAMSMDELTGGSLTNVAIRTAMANMELKADRYEWQLFKFVQSLLRLLGIETENIKFRRQTISDKSEIVADIYTMRADISRRKALELNPYIEEDEIDTVMEELDIEETFGTQDIPPLPEEDVTGDEA